MGRERGPVVWWDEGKIEALEGVGAAGVGRALNYGVDRAKARAPKQDESLALDRRKRNYVKAVYTQTGTKNYGRKYRRMSTDWTKVENGTHLSDTVTRSRQSRVAEDNEGAVMALAPHAHLVGLGTAHRRVKKSATMRMQLRMGVWRSGRECGRMPKNDYLERTVGDVERKLDSLLGGLANDEMRKG